MSGNNVSTSNRSILFVHPTQYTNGHPPAIEIDGGHHDFQIEADARRTAALEREGWRDAFPALVEANTASMDDLGTAVNAAAALGAVAISNSYGGGEDSSITTADSTWHIEVNGVDICPNPTVTVTQSGSAAGDVDVLEVGQSPASWVNEGDTIEFVAAGESDTTTITHFYAVIECH